MTMKTQQKKKTSMQNEDLSFKHFDMSTRRYDIRN